MTGLRRLRTSGAALTVSFGRRLAPLLAPGDVVVLAGDLGAGKTCLVKGVAEGLGVAEPVTSPTFNILLVHRGRLVLNHLDLYRLDREAQLDDIDFWGVLESGGVSFVEWGDRFPGALPGDLLAIEFHILGDEERELELCASGARSMALASAWSRACEAGRGARA